MKKLTVTLTNGYFFPFCLLILSLLPGLSGLGQSCPANSLTAINSFPNTYYPANQATVNTGSTSVALGAATYGNTPISTGDILLIIQMQGAQINSSNNNTYGDGSGLGSGYKVNGSLHAGRMEYVVASNSVPIGGGTLNITTGTVNTYKNTPFGIDGQYTYQVVRVPTYYNMQLTGTITAPAWNGATGGVLVLYASNYLDLNNQTIDASGAGFRGGGGRGLSGAGGYYNTDYVTMSSVNTNGSKGEGIAGTPMYINKANTTLLTNSSEGYPNGSYAQGAPGNAGGGGTDGNPGSNDQNTGGGGGGNGGIGGVGGWAWSSANQSGGRPGSTFSQASPARLVMGGGGGAGTSNNSTGTPGGGFASSGAAGGGLIIVYAGNAIIAQGNILANGASANSTVQNDGAGGGGAGGSILIFSKNGITSGITAKAIGGTGGSNEVGGGPSHGPGGGGGGGVIYSNASLNPASSVSGGFPGTTAGMGYSFGALSGLAGSITTNMNQSQPASFPLHCDVLGVSFLSLTATPDNGTNTLQWEVTREVNTVDYQVERSTDGTNFTVIGTVAYREGNATDNAYQYIDQEAAALSGKIYYRVREMDADGSATYSHIASVDQGSASGKLSVYPNPAQSSITVSFSASAAGAVSLRLFDLKGSQLWMQQYEAQPGINTVQVDYIRNLPDGLYILQWFDKLKSQQVKVMVRH